MQYFLKDLAFHIQHTGRKQPKNQLTYALFNGGKAISNHLFKYNGASITHDVTGIKKYVNLSRVSEVRHNFILFKCI